MISVFIVDDESLARERLKRMISALPDYHICGEANDGESAIVGIRKQQPDIVLLDIRMPGMDGLAVAEQLTSLSPPPAIIFCTAYDEYAIKAFQYQAIGYLLKPARSEELNLALNKARQLSQAQLRQLQMNQDTQSTENFVAHTWQGHELIPLSQIYYFRADHKYLTIVHRDGQTLSDQTLKELEARYASTFLRVHRNTLVNKAHIKALNKQHDGHFTVRLSNNEDIAVSRRHTADIRKQLTQL